MSTNPIVIPEKIHLQDIRVINGNIDANSDFSVKDLEGYETYYEVTSRVNENENVVRLVISAKFIAIFKKKKPLNVSAEYKVDFLYMIENLKDFLVKEGGTNGILLHGTLGATLAAISYSTLRGIILTRTQGTILQGIILPVINPSDLLTNKHSEPAKK
jgi:hypothetical protein